MFNFIWHWFTFLGIFPYKRRTVFRSYVGWLQNSMIRKNNALEKVDLGQKTGMLNYRTSMSKHFEGLHRQCTFCLLGSALLLNSFWNQEIGNKNCTHGTVVSVLLVSQYSLLERSLEMHSKGVCWIPVCTHHLASCWDSMCPETVVKAWLCQHCCIMLPTFCLDKIRNLS